LAGLRAPSSFPQHRPNSTAPECSVNARALGGLRRILLDHDRFKANRAGCLFVCICSNLFAVRQQIENRLENDLKNELVRCRKPAMTMRSDSSAQSPRTPIRSRSRSPTFSAVQGMNLCSLPALEHLQRHIGPLIQEAHAATRTSSIRCKVSTISGRKRWDSPISCGIAQAAPCQWLVDPAAAAQAVMLADLSSRLRFTGEEYESCATAWGECDFF